MDDLLPIAQQFAAPILEIVPLGNGLINDTFRVTTDSGCFVLQRINRLVFSQPEHIMANLAVLNGHIQQKAAQERLLQIPGILRTGEGAVLYVDNQHNYWRAIHYIDNSLSIETIRNLDDARQIGFALGHFHYLLNDLNPDLLQDTLPGFHIAPSYLAHYQHVSQQTKIKPDAYCAGFIADHAAIAYDLEQAKQQGLLAVRVIHGDPKINNFLFDATRQHIISLIDLDTVKPGLVQYDIGDCLRSCCHNETDNSFNLDIAEAILASYLAETAAFFTHYDYQFMYAAIRLIPFELGIRFYTDYLDGDRYFKVTEASQNLRRATTQFQLCASIIAQETAIQALIARIKP